MTISSLFRHWARALAPACGALRATCAAWSEMAMIHDTGGWGAKIPSTCVSRGDHTRETFFNSNRMCLTPTHVSRHTCADLPLTSQPKRARISPAMVNAARSDAALLIVPSETPRPPSFYNTVYSLALPSPPATVHSRATRATHRPPRKRNTNAKSRGCGARITTKPAGHRDVLQGG